MHHARRSYIHQGDRERRRNRVHKSLLIAGFIGSVALLATERMRAAFLLGGSKARGFFSEMLDALTTLLHERAVASAHRGDARRAVAAGRAIDAVETAKSRAAGNINPQLLGASLVRDLADILE